MGVYRDFLVLIFWDPKKKKDFDQSRDPTFDQFRLHFPKLTHSRIEEKWHRSLCHR